MAAEPDPKQPTCAVLVGGYSGLGVHTLLNALRFGPGKFSNVVFLSVGVVDSGNFKGADAMEDLKQSTPRKAVEQVCRLARGGWACLPWASCRSAPTRSTSWNTYAWR